MSPQDFVAFYGRVKASAILRTPLKEAVKPAMTAAVRAGFRIIEFTMNTPGALEQIAEFSKRDGLWVGAGTVLTVEQAKEAVRAGARFLVSPVVDENIISEAQQLGVAVMPGTHTPTEMFRAHRAGAQLQKLFPAPTDGPDYVRACLGPMPFLRIVPTSGVTLQNAVSYLRAGAFAVGIVNPLFDPEELEQGRFDLIEARGRAILTSISSIN